MHVAVPCLYASALPTWVKCPSHTQRLCQALAMRLLHLVRFVCGQVALSKTVYYDWSIDWVTASPDGFSRPVIGINGQWPCPQIDVDLGDRLIVTIYNNLGNESTGLHWHGINQYGHADMDGSAGVAQCPVPPNSSFTYDFPVLSS